MFDPDAMVLVDHGGDQFIVFQFNHESFGFTQIDYVPVIERLKILKKLKRHYRACDLRVEDSKKGLE